MIIQQHSVISVTYELHTHDLANNKTFIERAEKESPLTFLFGVGGMIPGFENNLKGKKSGDKFDFNISPTDAYGMHEAEAVVHLPKEIFKTEGMVDKELLQIGNIVPMMDKEGNRIHGKVLEVGEAQVKMDFNHPLAGKSLHFVGEIIAVRQASPDEIAHGHVHGEHEHHH